MSDIAWGHLEKMALGATELPSFPLNLREVRETVALLLNEVRRYGFFDEYTDHSFAHVEGMLRTAEWLIPSDARLLMTPADYLMLVLGIYFHDVGLLISRDEFSARASNADFQKFKNEPVISATQQAELRARLELLDPKEADRIWYQEFVRFHHGQRIRIWVEGGAKDSNDSSAPIRKIIFGLFEKLGITFRRDLALLCESHTRDDINDTAKYKLSQPYGDLEQESVNLQYVAAILRTVDLLQITKKRAPSVLYQIINPTDPLSQVEWQKQNAVRTVRARPGSDRDGNASLEVQPDTIEVHAEFEHADGFFGLTTYLAYAQREILSCFNAIAKSAGKIARPLVYPWRFIDSSNVEAVGFLTQSFGFTLDQQKILDLLTGHTLYNDTTVVLRELTQNALDAVRLQKNSEASELCDEGEINIVWRSASRELIVKDNGTGMSQEVIVNHLLKVGSSRYQDPQFKEKHPGFSSISRFGIGVLSAFMVSDDVEITTCSPDDDQARRIALRSVHGKYLIKLLDKIKDKGEIQVFPHGTLVRLVVRPTAAIGDVLDIARMWLMFPRCRVTVQIDENPPQIIGYASPKDAIQSYLSTSMAARARAGGEYEVREVEENGVTLAFAVSKNKLFRDWSFVQADSDSRSTSRSTLRNERPPIATCIEGVGVEFATPGFKGASILAIANATGPNAPKTNVARSALEDTIEQREMISCIYRLYARHVTNEIERLSSQEGYSLTRAVGEAPFIASSLIPSNVPPVRSSALQEAIAEIPMLVAESGGTGRSKVSFRDVERAEEFWTVESPLSRSIEYLVREAPENVTARTLLGVIGRQDSYPDGLTVLNFGASGYISEMLDGGFEISEVVASEASRRISLRWNKKGESSRWLRSADILRAVSQFDRRFVALLADAREATRVGRLRAGTARAFIPIGNIKTAGLDAATGFSFNQGFYFKSEEPVAAFFNDLWSEQNDDNLRGLALYFMMLEVWLGSGWKLKGMDEDNIKRTFDVAVYQHFAPYLQKMSGFLAAARGSDVTFFNPYAWDRKSA
ncbi:ATP-binding protein [Rhodanobacter sp. DHG33]|uniref:HD domain-containing protein n=1 Tax=Rhodanobacter sp. DHG33 TaxID=2775921 RepID=UPI0017854AAB|nr:ATP-binding protein [Rhodanobacter sp. DHG33]MBD8899024.1 ATP-binding protein [Rhodanobacter sp. DHG33]